MTEAAPQRTGRRGGTRLRSSPEELPGRASEAAQPLVARWLAWATDTFGPALMAAAAEEARQGRLASIQIGEGRILAAIRGGTRPSTVTLQFATLADAQWDRLMQQMAQGAISEASLLAGELPPSILQLADAAGAPLAPPNGQRPQVKCDPPRSEAESERAAAVVCLCALERMVTEPLAVFALRGRPVQRLLEQLREMRVMQVQGAAAAHGDPFTASMSQSALPLEQCTDEFWGSGAMLHELAQLEPPRHAPHALLRRLGPSPLGGKFPLVGLLASVYDVVSQSALQLRDRAEHLDAEAPPATPADDANAAD